VSEQEHNMCQKCGKRKATVHLTDLTTGKPVQMHLCNECYAAQEGVLEHSPSKLFAQLIEAVAPELKELSTKTCPKCGINYLEFRQKMTLGCPYDYEAFDQALEQLLERIHGATVHIGKVPRRLSGQGRSADELVAERMRALEEQLEEAVAGEAYERAAKLRDRIRKLKEHGSEQPQHEGG